MDEVFKPGKPGGGTQDSLGSTNPIGGQRLDINSKIDMILRTYVIALHEATFSIAVVCHPSFYEWRVSGVAHRF